MNILITTISIFLIICLSLIFNKFFGKELKICPVCAGVAGTWAWMLVARFIGYEVDLMILSMLLGGSIVGIAYQIEKRSLPRQSSVLLKISFIPIGFISVYGLLSQWWIMFGISMIVLLGIAFLFLRQSKNPDNSQKTIEDLKEKLKNCC